MLPKTAATGNSQPQFILSTTNIANVEQQALMQQLLLQNTFVIGCNSLFVTSAGRLDDVPAQTINCVATCTGVPATVKAEPGVDSRQVTGNQNGGCCTDEVCVDHELVVFNHRDCGNQSEQLC